MCYCLCSLWLTISFWIDSWICKILLYASFSQHLSNMGNHMKCNQCVWEYEYLCKSMRELREWKKKRCQEYSIRLDAVIHEIMCVSFSIYISLCCSSHRFASQTIIASERLTIFRIVWLFDGLKNNLLCKL